MHSGTPVTERHISRRAMSWIWLICFTFTSFSILAFDSPGSPDLVFCPLQKHWVKKNPPPRIPDVSLIEICASGKSKSAFFEQLALTRRSISNHSLATEQFLRFAARGKQVFGALPRRSDLPEQLPASLAKNSAGNNVGRASNELCLSPLLIFYSKPHLSLLLSAGTSCTEADHKISSFPVAADPRGPPVSF
jgi:hypothetical protein